MKARKRSASVTQNLKKTGICIKSRDGLVESQNKICQEICGDHVGEKCLEGCMKHYKGLAFEGQDFDVGFRLIKNVVSNGHTVDVVMINDGDELTTLLLDKSESIGMQLAYLKQFNLSKSEMVVMQKFLSGFSAKEIASQLFISKSTLRSHLNNIYKKLPEELKEEIISSHLGRNLNSKKSQMK